MGPAPCLARVQADVLSPLAPRTSKPVARSTACASRWQSVRPHSRRVVVCCAPQGPQSTTVAQPPASTPVKVTEHTASAVIEQFPHKQRYPLRSPAWPQKSALYILRTDGRSCSRELVTGNGKLSFAYPSTQQHLLVWRNRPHSVMVLKKLGEELTEQWLEVVKYLGASERMHVVVEPSVYEQHIAHRTDMDYCYSYTPEEAARLHSFVDFVVCLGGDGVILHASYLFGNAMPPVIAFHLGSMGFLTQHHYDDFKKDLREVIYGSQKLASCSIEMDTGSMDGNTLGVMITLRMRLQCEIVRAGSDEPAETHEVLNELVIDRGSNSFLTNIECYESGRFVTRVQADGVMLATPTGSTAYSLAAGGSMVHPNVPAILLTPICPHSLNFRPIILPDYAELELRVPHDARCSAWVCFDGKYRQELHKGDIVRVKMSANPVPTINKIDLTGDWFDSLQRCLRWSERLEQKPLALPELTAAAAPQQQQAKVEQKVEQKAMAG